MRIGNWPLLLLALEHVIRHPEEYDQSTWRGQGSCGTTRCIAGWVAFWSGWADVQCTASTAVEHPRHGMMTTEAAALNALELDPDLDPEDVASALFNGDRTFEDVLQAVWDFARADGVTPTPLIMAELVRHGIIEKETV